MTGDSGARPLVSFVLPAYNEEDRLPDGLQRVITFLGAQSPTASSA
jgi:hypothetical protein